jgi:energy-coupling factor transporter ATP-binding protein EcfA2
MRLSKIEVTKLFGVFNHSIPLNLTDRITIFHGPNGYGKTALLLLIRSVLENRLSRLRRVPFERFTLSFDTEMSLSVEKRVKAGSDGDKSGTALHFEYFGKDEVPQEYSVEFPKQRQLRFPLSIIDRQFPRLNRIGPETWIDEKTGMTLDLDDILDRYGNELPLRSEAKERRPEWLSNLSNLDVRLIEAQRLLNIRQPHEHRTDEGFSARPAVLGYSKELAASIQQIQAKYGTFSQQLDSTFPTRVIQAPPTAPDDPDSITKKLVELEEKRQRIIAAGLLTTEQHPPPFFGPQQIMDDRTKSILAIYSEDVRQKLGVLDEIAPKVELFKELVNKRFTYKEFSIDRENGFCIKTKAGGVLSPTELSSGEQHEIVLLYELLFKTKRDALILIDEPELSLHVAWQVEFLKDLTRIISLSPFDVVLATHSPQIINNRWDLTVELKGPNA